MLAPEWILVRRDRALWIALFLALILCAISLWNGFSWVRDQHDVSQRAAVTEASEYRERKNQVVEWQTHPRPAVDPVLLDLYDPRTPYAVGQAGRIAQLPLLPLTATCIGQLDLLPVRQSVSIRTRMRTLGDKDGLANPLNLMSGRFDLAFVIVYLLPLLMIAITYDTISLESEQGTLALIESQPVTAWDVLIAKLGLRGLVLVGGLILFCTTVLLSQDGWRDPSRLLLWMAVSLAYGGFWWSLAFWISSRGHSSVVNAALLVTCWLVFVAVIPALLQVVVGALRPAPDRMELVYAIRERSIDQRRDGKPLAEAWYAQHPELLPAGTTPVYDTAVTGTMTHIEQDRRTLPLERKFDQQLMAQQQLVYSLRLLSPAIIANEAFQEVAGTGLPRHRHFRQQIAEFRERWLAWFHPRIFRHVSLQPAEYDVMPVFSWTEEALRGVLWRVLPGITALLALSGVLLGFANRRIE